MRLSALPLLAIALGLVASGPSCYRVIGQRDVNAPERGPATFVDGRIYVPYARTHTNSTPRRAGWISSFSNEFQDEWETEVTGIEKLGSVVVDLATGECRFDRSPPPPRPPRGAPTVVVGAREFGWRRGEVVELGGGGPEVVYRAVLAVDLSYAKWLPAKPWTSGPASADHEARLEQVGDRMVVRYTDGQARDLAPADAPITLFGDHYAVTPTWVYGLRARRGLAMPAVTKVALGPEDLVTLKSADRVWRGPSRLDGGDFVTPEALPLGAFRDSIYFDAIELSSILRFDAATRTWHELPYLRCAPQDRPKP